MQFNLQNNQRNARLTFKPTTLTDVVSTVCPIDLSQLQMRLIKAGSILQEMPTRQVVETNDYGKINVIMSSCSFYLFNLLKPIISM